MEILKELRLDIGHWPAGAITRLIENTAEIEGEIEKATKRPVEYIEREKLLRYWLQQWQRDVSVLESQYKLPDAIRNALHRVDIYTVQNSWKLKDFKIWTRPGLNYISHEYQRGELLPPNLDGMLEMVLAGNRMPVEGIGPALSKKLAQIIQGQGARPEG